MRGDEIEVKSPIELGAGNRYPPDALLTPFALLPIFATLYWITEKKCGQIANADPKCSQFPLPAFCPSDLMNETHGNCPAVFLFILGQGPA